jgi:E3 ubiquitin-protein ligase BRE1
VAAEELRNQVLRRGNDSDRLREQRDQQLSELNERKHKESVKMASLNEFKALAESRSDRIAVLESELKRHKTQLAANAGNQEILTFLLGDNPENVSYVDDLKKRVA